MQSSYAKISQMLDENRVSNSLAGIHGLVAGLLCTGNAEADPEDIGQLLQPPQNLPELARKLLAQLAESSKEQLGSPEYNFQLMLPPDDDALRVRVIALGEWCEGFTVGFAAANFLPDSRLGAEVREILTDFAQFAGIADTAAEFSDKDEVDFMEIVEYVRVAATTVYQQLAETEKKEPGPTSASTAPGTKFLH